jgi:1-phosphofructokinase family hexose kinase
VTLGITPGGAHGPVRRLVCVSLNTSVDRIVAVARLVPGEIHRPTLLSVVPGGKALNVARSAAAMGMASIAIPVLAGHAGRWIDEALHACGVASRPVWIAGETRECLSILDRSTGRLTELYEAGPGMDEAGWAAIEDALRAELADDARGTLVAVSGSVPPGAPADAHARIVALARHTGARAAVDVGGAPLARAVAAGPWLAKANAQEAADATGILSGGEGEALAAARALRDAGATMALVSRGVDGVLFVDETGAAWRIGPPPERGAFAVGSGDSLLGGFAAALASGHPAAEAVRRGSAVATANALHPGQGIVDPADVARLLPALTLERIEPEPFARRH